MSKSNCFGCKYSLFTSTGISCKHPYFVDEENPCPMAGNKPPIPTTDELLESAEKIAKENDAPARRIGLNLYPYGWEAVVYHDNCMSTNNYRKECLGVKDNLKLALMEAILKAAGKWEEEEEK